MEHNQDAKQGAKRRGLLWIMLAASLLIIAAVWFATADMRNVHPEVTLEAGDMLSADLFFKTGEADSQILTDLSSIDTTIPGTYPVQIQTRMRVMRSTLVIRDTAAPTAQSVSLETFLGDLPEAGAFITDIEDVTSVTVSYKKAPAVTTPGEAQGVVLLTDASGNRTELDVSLLVIADTTAPVITGVADATVFLNDPIDMEAGVSVSDDYDSAPQFEIDLGGLDTSAAGVYTVTYTAEDFSGNTAVLTATVTVIADTTAPVITGVADATVFLNDPIDMEAGVSVSDDYDSAPQFEIDLGGLDTSAAGVYTVTYTAADFSGNTAVLTATVTVIEDTAAPTITGVADITIYKGEAADYISGVSAYDDHDPSPALTIDDGDVDLTQPGEYTVTYRAEDFSGNIVSAAAKITVLDDVTPPVISGVKDWGVYIGDSADYASGVSAADERDPAPVLTMDDSGVDLTQPGEYTVTFTAADDFGNVSTAVSRIVVKADKEAPVISGVMDHEVYLGDTIDLHAGVSAADNRDGALDYALDTADLDWTVPRTYYVYYTCTDSSGNTAEERSRIRVMRDTKAPTIEGAADITVELGGTVSYRKGITVTDNHDPAPKLTIDNSAVNLNKIGKYKVHYTAEDSSGNTRTVTIRVQVTRKQMTEEDLDLLWPLVDEVLAGIITDDMSPMQKGFKIYGWAERNIRYTGYSDKSHWVMGAYDGFTKHSGDCFTFFAVSKAMLERVGIDNVDVVKSDTRYSSHYWSLINIGTGWYHFDSCRFAAGADDFYMLTDAELAHWDRTRRNAHPFDSSLYPERATESVQSRLNYSNYTVKE